MSSFTLVIYPSMRLVGPLTDFARKSPLDVFSLADRLTAPIAFKLNSGKDSTGLEC